ncbi:MAG TPA: hypothetical protein H9711_03920 [Candidatus Mediterraneibacter intestinavium]|nr:hypothetical protein [Candidatus Mediterraneibacter intestinavium]
MLGGLITTLFQVIGGIFSMIFSLVWWILMIVADWKVLNKAGEPGWKSIIPFYDSYTFYKIAWDTRVFWLWLALAVGAGIFEAMSELFFLFGVIAVLCNLAYAVINFLYCICLASSFGKGKLFGVGLWLAGPIFTMILAFGPARYQGRSSFSGNF